MSSRWNAYLDRKLELGPRLKTEHHRLADAIARCTLGFNTPSEELGEKLLMERSGLLHGRSFSRARDELVALGLLSYTPPAVRGRGHRGRYELLLDGGAGDDGLGPLERVPPDPDHFAGGGGESPAGKREIQPETPAETRAQIPAESHAQERERYGGKEVEEEKDFTAPTPPSAKTAPGSRDKLAEPFGLDEEADHALCALVGSLNDADQNTLPNWRREFASLSYEDFKHAHQEVVAERVQLPGRVGNEAGYAHQILVRCLDQDAWNEKERAKATPRATPVRNYDVSRVGLDDLFGEVFDIGSIEPFDAGGTA